jgi:ribose transport system ATP-binding protein
MDNGKVLEIRNISKHFAGVQALIDVSFDIEKGTCHCLIGENGAGKSTLIKILTGALKRSSGEVVYKGKLWEPNSTRDAMRSGIGCLFQELNVVEQLRVEEYVCLGLEETTFGIIRRRSNTKVFDILAKIDKSINPKQMIEELSVAKRQVVEIAKALAMDSDVIIMDEPTSPLSAEETRHLFDVIRDLKAQGITIIYITHRLEEVMELGDFVTVLRDGRHIGTKPKSEIHDRQELIRMMIGKNIFENYVPNTINKDHKLIEVKGMTNRKLKNISFDLSEGEILGFYGLIGAGKTEIARAIYGLDPFEGELVLNGRKISNATPQKSLKGGVALVPEERRTQGICTSLSIVTNMPMMNYKSVSRRGIISNVRQRQLAKRYIEEIDVSCRNENQTVAYLSGGNQQKVIIGKCLNVCPRVMLLDEPTRGIDVGAKQEIYNIIRKLAKSGCSAIIFSSELAEICCLCDRIGLLYEGELKGFVNNQEMLDSQNIMHIVTGGTL